jgi:hypothetical protein
MKTIFTILFIISFSVFSFSQKNTTSIYGGLNFSTWTGNANGFAENLVEETIDLQWLSKYDYENKFRLGFTIGFNMEFKISGNFYFQPGVSYSQKGTGFKGFNKNVDMSIERKLKMITNFIELPLLYKINIPSGKETFYLFGGPVIGYLIDSKISAKIDTYFRTMNLENCNSFQINLNIGAGIDFCKKFKIEIKYDAGLSSVFDTHIADNYNLKNSTISICFAYHN